MLTFLSDIPADERVSVIVFMGAIVFVMVGLSYFHLKYKYLALKKMTRHASDAFKAQTGAEIDTQNAKNYCRKASAIYSFVGIGLVLIFQYFPYPPLLYFGIASIICGIIQASLALMTDNQFRAYAIKEQKKSFFIARIFIVCTVLAYIVWMFLPDSFIQDLDVLGIFGLLGLFIAVIGGLNHFYRRVTLD